MSDDADTHNPIDHANVWKDWNETATRLHSSHSAQPQETYSTPYDLYYAWMKPITFFQQWHEATSGTWLRMVGQAMNPSWLIEANCRFITTALGMSGTCSSNTTSQGYQSQPPARRDLAEVAAHVNALEERVYTIEDAFVYAEDSEQKGIGDQAIEDMKERLERVENVIDDLNTRPADTRISIDKRNGESDGFDGLAERMERMEEKLNTLLAVLARMESRTYLETTISNTGGEVESKPQNWAAEIQQVESTSLD